MYIKTRSLTFSQTWESLAWCQVKACLQLKISILLWRKLNHTLWKTEWEAFIWKKKDIDVYIPQDFHHEDADNFENVEHENPTNLAAITRELDDLCHRVHAGEGQPTEAPHHIECKLQRLSIALHPSAPPEPLNDILKQYTYTLCSAQKQTNFCKHLNTGYTYL